MARPGLTCRHTARNKLVERDRGTQYLLKSSGGQEQADIYLIICNSSRVDSGVLLTDIGQGPVPPGLVTRMQILPGCHTLDHPGAPRLIQSD